MRILMLKMDPPFPLESGTDWVSYHLLRTLALEHRITYVTLTRSAEEERALEEIGKYCDRVIAVRRPNARSFFHRAFYKGFYGLLSVATGVPMVVWYNTPFALRRTVRRLLDDESFDMIHVEYWYAALYARYARSGRRVLLKHDVAYLADLRLSERRDSGLRAWLARRRIARFRRAELGACRGFDAVFTLTDADRDALAGVLGDRIRIEPLPTLYLPFAKVPRGREDARRIVFVGHLARPLAVDAVTWFCDEVLPRIRARLPDVTLEVIGGGEARARHLAGRPGVRLAGFVTDVPDRIGGAAVMVAPLRGGTGIKIKIIEGMFAGLPIVTTSIGAEGIGVTHGREVMIADDAESFARCTLDLLEQPERRMEMGDSARLFADRRFGSAEAQRRLLDFYAGELAAVA